jgi:hypothetical protein
MPETISLNYRLTKELWRQFFDAHYSRQQVIKFHYLWGVICLLIGALGFGGFYESKLIAGLLMTTGFYGVLSKHLLIYKSLRVACKHPFFGKELWVVISPEEISVSSEGSGYRQPWNNFVGYRKQEPGFLLYHDRNAFFFIPGGVMTVQKSRRIVQILEAAGVPKT